VKEAPLSMLLPMIIIAGGCVLFGLWNALPLENLIVPILPPALRGEHVFAGWPTSMMLVGLTLAALLIAVLNHWYGVKKSGSGLGASDHIHYAPVLGTIYDKAEKRWFDPYDLGLKILAALSRILWGLDRVIDWLYDGLAVNVAYGLGTAIRAVHTGNYSMYVFWSLVGAAAVLAFLIRAL
jgi:NADH-quinone oxidoreductase subunit L